jgi:hypothetical protein
MQPEAVFPNLFSTGGTPKIISLSRGSPNNENVCRPVKVVRWERYNEQHLVVYGEYTRISNCRGKNPGIF